MQRPDLIPLFEPRGVVVVGASGNPEKLGHAMASSLASFPGTVQLVNSRPTQGMFSSITEAVGSARTHVDLAVMCLPAAATATALRDSASAGVRAALVCAGGFAEAGGIGLDYASDVDAVVRETGIRMLGPNTSGFFIPHADLFASFVPGVREFGAGSVAIVAASGGVNHVLAFQLSAQGEGVSVGVGVGAGQDVGAPEVLDYLATHQQTRAVILHVETVPDGAALLAAVSALSAIKPVVALVIGRNDVAEFAQSHTGALATSWRTTRAVLQQAGAQVVDDVEHAVAAAITLSGRRARPSTSPGIGLVTGQAGPGLIIADALASAGVAVPRLSESTIATIGTLLPPMTYQANPVDTGRPGDTFPAIISVVAGDPAVDVIGIYAITEPVVDLAVAVADAKLGPDVPVVLGVDGPEAEVSAAQASAHSQGVVLLRGPTRLAQGLAALESDARTQARRARDREARATVGVDKQSWSGDWDEIRSKDLIASLGIATPPRRRCSTRAEAHAAFLELEGPVAVKIVDAKVLHKTELGGVHLGIDSTKALDDALSALESIGASEFLVERMAPSGLDLVVGARVDPVFGPVVLLGLGGTAAEVLGDVAIRSAPISPSSAALMVDDLAARDLLFGYRGGPTVDVDELGRLIASMGEIVAAGVVLEIEVNPLRCTMEGSVALDAVVIPKVTVNR